MLGIKPKLLREDFEKYLQVLYGFELLKIKGHRGAIVSLGGYEDKVYPVSETGYVMKDQRAVCNGHGILEVFSADDTHDLGVVVLDGRVLAAHCQFPMPQFDPQWDEWMKKLGSRHRAAMGMSQETGAEVLILSEESGDIRVARGGKLYSICDVFEAIRKDQEDGICTKSQF